MTSRYSHLTEAERTADARTLRNMLNEERERRNKLYTQMGNVQVYLADRLKRVHGVCDELDVPTEKSTYNGRGEVESLTTFTADERVEMAIDKLQCKVEKMKAALNAVEWMPLATHVGIMCCPWCLSSRKLGHSVDCQRQAALRKGIKCSDATDLEAHACIRRENASNANVIAAITPAMTPCSDDEQCTICSNQVDKRFAGWVEMQGVYICARCSRDPSIEKATENASAFGDAVAEVFTFRFSCPAASNAIRTAAILAVLCEEDAAVQQCNHDAFNWDLVYRCRGCGAVLLEKTCKATLEKHAVQVAEECAAFLERNADGPGGEPITPFTDDHNSRIEYRHELLTNAANAIREKFCNEEDEREA